MNVNVLHVDGCPSLDPLLKALNALIGDRDDVAVSTTLVSSNQEAARLGFHGSPTILIDGHDPFPWPNGRIGLSCRVYMDASGKMAGAPSREMLAAALGI
ncbi:MAG: thioredoxin family protein [Actinomycetota bacterium]|nr:thioredoxin family protein [Actinomycetota bacterium]